MNDDIQTEKAAKKRPPLQKWAMVGVIAFAVLGSILAAPCLCPEGAAKSDYKIIFYLIVLVRLLYGLSKRKFLLSDYVLWVGFYIAFCISVDLFL